MRTFGLLLRLYPASFRNEYGEEMRALHRHRRSIASGPFEVAGLWISTVWDVLVNAAREHADILRQDLRWSSRSLTRAPGFAAAAIAVAALGIGASTASFSTLDRLLLRPLPFPDSDRIVNLWQGQRGASGYNELSPGNYRDWRTQSRSFESMAAIVYRSVNLVSDGSPARLDTVAVTSDFFRVLRVRAQIGRLFGASDFSAEGDVPIVLSDTLWRERFGADPGVLGKRLLLDDEPSIVVGVLARGFEFPDRRLALWSPLDFVEEDYAERDNTYLRGVARLRPGVPIEGARSELAVVSTRMEQAYPIENEKLEPIVWRLREQVGRQPRMLAFALFGAALCVLL
ncbi:MAG TPA: ABC transporter permease, partial [Candidatus Eisenbacteria bacterium]